MIKTIKLNWEGPFSFNKEKQNCIFNNLINKKPGIYLLTVPYGRGYLIYYIGETGKSFNERMDQHLQKFIAGEYRIYNPEAFLRGEKELIWNPYIVGRGAKYRYDFKKEYLEHKSEIDPLIKTYVDQFCLFVAPFHRGDRIRKLLESAIAKHLLNQNQSDAIRKFQDDDIVYVSKSSEDSDFVIEMQMPEKLYGLSKKMRV